ncbi:MAG: amino acid permease [Candidatus Micrarchaeota archaeon]|nr:MAG: amino acid permease [Candidatus Micrarchaeota archaeon]
MELKRQINLRDAVIINLGAIIGAGIFVIIGLAAGLTGSSITLSIVIAALISILTGLSFGYLALFISKEGGSYEYAKEALSPYAGFIAGIAWALGNSIALAAVSLSTGSYIDALLGLHISDLYIAIADIIAFTIINLLGLKNSTKSLTILVSLNILVLIIFVLAGLTHISLSNLSSFVVNGVNGIFAATAVIFFAFTGFSRVTTLSEEVIDPENTIPKAIIYSIIISSLIYFAVTFVAVGLAPYYKLASSKSPLSLAISVTGLKILYLIISLGGVTATAGVTLTGILGVSRVLFAMSRDRILPKKLSYINDRGIPPYAILATSAVALIFLIFLKFSSIVDAANLGVLTSYLIVNIAALYASIKERRAAKGIYGSKRFYIIPLIGAASIVFIAAYLEKSAITIIVSLLILATFYYIFLIEERKIKKIPRFIEIRDLKTS